MDLHIAKPSTSCHGSCYPSKASSRGMHAPVGTLCLPPPSQVEEGADEITWILPNVHFDQIWSVISGVLLLKPLLERLEDLGEHNDVVINLSSHGIGQEAVEHGRGSGEAFDIPYFGQLALLETEENIRAQRPCHIFSHPSAKRSARHPPDNLPNHPACCKTMVFPRCINRHGSILFRQHLSRNTITKSTWKQVFQG